MFVVLVDVVVWTENNEIELPNDGNSLLSNFDNYRNNILMKVYPHDYSQLLTRKQWDSSYGQSNEKPAKYKPFCDKIDFLHLFFLIF